MAFFLCGFFGRLSFRGRGFAPERRGPFVSAKGPKTIDAPSGLMRKEGRKPFKERTNSPGSHKVRSFEERPSLGPAGRRRTTEETFMLKVRACLYTCSEPIPTFLIVLNGSLFSAGSCGTWLLNAGVSTPDDEPLLFRQKWPKPCWPWHGPSGSLRNATDIGGGQTRGACPEFSKGSNSARLFSDTGCTARPCHQARGAKGKG